MRQIENLEAEIEELESQSQAISEQMLETNDADKLMELQAELDKNQPSSGRSHAGVGRIIRAGVKMEHLGKVFREFRTSGNYSLKEAAGSPVQPLSYLVLSLGSLT